MAGIFLLKAFESGKRIYLGAWAAMRTLMILTLPLTAVLIGIDVMMTALNKERKKFAFHVLGWLSAVAVLWSPILRIMFGLNASSPYDEWRAVLPNPLPSDFLTMIVNFTCSAIPLQEWKGPPVQDWFSALYVVALGCILACGIAFSKNKAAIFWGLLPLFCFFAVSFVAKPLLITRYVMFTAPFIFIVVATGWVELWSRYRPVAIVCQLIFALTIGANLSYFYSHPVHEDWRMVANYVSAHEKQNDEIAVWNYHCQYSFPYYYKGKNHISDIKIYMKDRNDLSKGSYVEFINSKPTPGQRILLVARVPSIGWTDAYSYYQIFLKNLDKQFKVLHKERVGMHEVFEVTLI